MKTFQVFCGSIIWLIHEHVCCMWVCAGSSCQMSFLLWVTAKTVRDVYLSPAPLWVPRSWPCLSGKLLNACKGIFIHRVHIIGIWADKVRGLIPRLLSLGYDLSRFVCSSPGVAVLRGTGTLKNDDGLSGRGGACLQFCLWEAEAGDNFLSDNHCGHFWLIPHCWSIPEFCL